MYHSVIFGEKNTYGDWKIVPSSRPVINPPTQKTKILDIPGADGVLDISEALTGYPVYNNRAGSLEFMVLNDYEHYHWEHVYSEIVNYLHSKKTTMILEDDPAYFYEGRFHVNDWKSNKDWSTITIDYDVGPYKWQTVSSLEPSWEWDSFNFETDYIMSAVFKDIVVTPSKPFTFVFTYEHTGEATICPYFNVSGAANGLTVTVINPNIGKTTTQTITNGRKKYHNLLLFGGNSSMTITGNGTVSIDFRRGRL